LARQTNIPVRKQNQNQDKDKDNGKKKDKDKDKGSATQQKPRRDWERERGLQFYKVSMASTMFDHRKGTWDAGCSASEKSPERVLGGGSACWGELKREGHEERTFLSKSETSSFS
jgi:hypothetical protein